MKKLVNDVDDMLIESLEGLAAAQHGRLVLNRDPLYIRRADAPVAGKVALVSGGGSGHEPLDSGFVGPGMLDAACPGPIFTAPTPDQAQAAAEAVAGGAGVLFIMRNTTADVTNFEAAAEMTQGACASLRVDDDVAVENSPASSGRRGGAGTLIVQKILGAAAEAGHDLAALKALGERVVERTGSMGVALSSCTVPTAARPAFTLGPDEIEIGIGIHGEPGRRREKMSDADGIAHTLASAILEDMRPARGETALLLINGMGATPTLELTLMHHAVERLLAPHGIAVVRSLVGSYVTALDMAGCSVTLTLLDDEMRRFWDAPCATPALTVAG